MVHRTSEKFTVNPNMHLSSSVGIICSAICYLAGREFPAWFHINSYSIANKKMFHFFFSSLNSVLTFQL